MAEIGAPLRWGVLGTGSIARAFARALTHSHTGVLAAVASRSREAVEDFESRFGPVRSHVGYENLIADRDVDVVYISTPHPFHAEWCLRAARAGKHILCEKPLTMNLAEAQAVVEAARANDVFLMEAFMYRCHPQTAKLVELIRAGAIGRVGSIQVALSVQVPFRPESRHFSKELGGGAILDVGCYTISMARLIAGVATGLPFADPVSLQGRAVLSPVTGVDLYSVAMAEFPGDILVQLSCGLGLEQDRHLRIYGSEGSLHVPLPFGISKDGGSGIIRLQRPGREELDDIPVPAEQSPFTIELDTVGAAIQAGTRESAAMTLADSLGNMAALDQWRASAGLA